MNQLFRYYIRLALLLLLTTLIVGLIAGISFLYPETFNNYLPFYQLRPIHVSAAVFWIITSATGSILYYKRKIAYEHVKGSKTQSVFMLLWILTIIIIFINYAFKQFGGREYWDFPPVLCLPLLISWLFLLITYFQIKLPKNQLQPVYVWMWSTGIFFFLLTFTEQNLWQIPWFRNSYLKEVTIQWKANGSLVGSWNQMIYGLSMFLMVKMSKNPAMARSRLAFALFFLGLTNLLFNWGHHIYNLPVSHWVRDISYAISMTEWIFFVRIIAGFKKTMDESMRLEHLISFRFIIAAEFWVFANMFLAAMLSIPAINRYTHGTHVIVAHSMGTTIGINTMILLGSLSYMLGINEIEYKLRRYLMRGFWLSQISLVIFWLALIAAGFIKGYRTVAMHVENYQDIMAPAMPFIKLFIIAGVGLVLGLGTITVILLKKTFGNPNWK